MTNNPLVSVILPSHNREKYISQTIESCLAQTYTNFELIIIDDCSSDTSVDIIKTYAARDQRIKLIRNSANKKLPATLNIGFRVAKGEYYSWISDDNLFVPNALEVMVETLDVNQEVGLVYADYTTISSEGKTIARIYQESPEYLPIRDCVGACFLYRATVAEQVGKYNEQLFLIEDYEYWLRFGLQAKMYHIPESLYLYRVHSASLTQSRQEEIKLAKNALKRRFAGRYHLSAELQPIDKLYRWFISDHRGVKAYIEPMKIILQNPIITIGYIMRNIVRLWR